MMGLSDQVAIGIIQAVFACGVVYFGYRAICRIAKVAWQEFRKRPLSPQTRELVETLEKTKKILEN